MHSKTFSVFHIASILFFSQCLHGQSMLWRISGNTLTKPSYLYGTIHIKDKRVFILSDSVYTAQASCEKTVLELDLNPETQYELSRLMRLRNGKTLQDFYTQDELKHIDEILSDKAGLSIDMFMKLHPVALLTVMADSYFPTDMPYSLDEFFHKEAVRLGKKVVGLETIEEQYSAIQSIAPSDIFTYLTDTATNEQLAEPMISAYLQADFSALSQLMVQDSLMLAYSEALLIKRNTIMAKRIDSLLQESTCFIGIGAGHLKAENGVVDLLLEKGYAVEPVFSSFAKSPTTDSTIKWTSIENELYTCEFPEDHNEMSMAHMMPDAHSHTRALVASISSKNIELFLLDLSANEQAISEEQIYTTIEETASVFKGTITEKETVDHSRYKSIYATIALGKAGTIRQRHIFWDNNYVLLQSISIDKGNIATERFFNSFEIK